MRKKMAVLMCLLLVSSMVATTAAVSAKKPEKPPPEPEPTPTGTIYYVYSDGGPYHVWSMNPDGRSRSELYQFPGGMMSREEHGGEYWFVYFARIDGTYPDGQPCQEIFVCKGGEGEPDQITDDTTLATSRYSCQVTWGPDDAFISWSAYRWGTDAEGDYVYDAGIYTAVVNYDDNGDVTGLGTITLVLDTGYWTSTGAVTQYRPVARDNLDWSPDGEKVVYGTNDGLYLYDTVGDSSSFLASGWYPQWSPDGSLITYVKADLFIINPDGTGGTKIVDVTDTVQMRLYVSWTYWSPDGEFLVYYKYAIGNNKVNMYIHVVQKDGTDDSCISRGLTTAEPKPTVGWR